MEECGNVDLEDKTLNLTGSSVQMGDRSSENQTECKEFELSKSVNAEKEGDITCISNKNNQLPEPQQSVEPERGGRSERCNLRKSLAWDSAFFTNAGVLEPDELSSMIKGSQKGEKNLLPGIEEDMQRSTESISTLESDSLTLESLEADLFLDIRASIQRSSKKSSNAPSSTGKAVSKEIENEAISSLKKEDLASPNRLNLGPGSKKTTRMTAIRMSKCQPKQNNGIQGFGKAVRKDSGHPQVAQSVSKINGPTSSLPKPPKTVNKIATTSAAAATKRASLGANSVKSVNGSTKLSSVASKGNEAPKAPVLGARRLLRNPAVSSKSSSLSSLSSIKKQSLRSSTSSESSDSMSSKTTTKSPLMMARRNVVKSSKTSPASSGSVPKTQPRLAVKNKPPASSLTSHLMPAKISSSTSPASSISEWSSTSSSSSCTINHRSNNSRTSLDTTSSKFLDGDVLSKGQKNQSYDQTVGQYESRAMARSSNNAKSCSVQTSSLPHQASGKPSGLRMPSPKIGFFDGVKSARTPNGALKAQSGLPTQLPKTGTTPCSPNGGSNRKLKVGKLPMAKAANVSPKAKVSARKAISPCSSLNAIGNRSKASEIQTAVLDGVKHVGEAVPDANTNDNLGTLHNETALDLQGDQGSKENAKVIPAEGRKAIASQSGQTVEGLEDAKNQLKNNSNPISENNEKENGRFEDQIDGLRGQKMDVSSNLCSEKDNASDNTPECFSVALFAKSPDNKISRAPLAVKNSSRSSEILDSSKEVAFQPAENTLSPLPSWEHKDNS